MSGDRSGVAVSGDLLAQLEDSQTDGDDEGEEGQLKGVPGLESQDTNGQRDEGYGLEQDEDQNGDDDLLELGLAGLDGAAFAELEVEAQLVVVDVAGGHLDGGVEGQLEGDVVGGQVAADRLEERAITEAATGQLVNGVRVAGDLYGLRYLRQWKKLKIGINR